MATKRNTLSLTKRINSIDRLGKNSRGFTMIEIIAVLVILGIITAVAISRGTATDAVKVQAEVDILKSQLRYAQYLAMNDVSSTTTGYVLWGINIGTSSYELVKYVGGVKVTPTPFNLPNESSPTHSFASPITATAATALVLFDEWGSPCTTALVKLPIVTITLNPGSQSIAITPETGFIP